MDDALGDAFMVEVRDLLAHDEVFQQRRPARAGLEAVLVIGDLHALVGAQRLPGGIAAKRFQALQVGVGIGPVGVSVPATWLSAAAALSCWPCSALLISLQAARTGLFK
jgi:hypothetical protein